MADAAVHFFFFKKKKTWLQTMAEIIPLLRSVWSIHMRRMYLNEIMLAKGIYVTVIRLCCCVRY